ncbi:hypothetical protein HK100_011636 [Physocladia obscura]|uniref:Uncharacterized protein n=1 Tax=Physocladia obscura TaxID=109957 RepID=A0AAD5T3T3_9FUNG|nr:hypothetical protein HK100_011636 [Physocladia obscura]
MKTNCEIQILQLIKLALSQLPKALDAKKLLLANDLYSIIIQTQLGAINSLPWPPLPSRVYFQSVNLDDDSNLLGFSISPKIAQADVSRNPKSKYDTAIANVMILGSCYNSFQTLFSLAMCNHHPSKMFFDPKSSPISNDPIAAHKLGIFLLNSHAMISLALKWFKKSSDAKYPPGMLEYAKILSSPGWAYSETATAPATYSQDLSLKKANLSGVGNMKTKVGNLSVASKTAELLENSIDAIRSLRLLQESYAAETSADAAFCIGMIYMTAPTRASVSKATSRKNSNPIYQSNNNADHSFRTEKITKIMVIRDIAKANAWLTQALELAAIGSPIRIYVKYQLARLYLMTSNSSITEQQKSYTAAVNFLRSLVMEVEERKLLNRVVEIITALSIHLLGTCLKNNIGANCCIEQVNALHVKFELRYYQLLQRHSSELEITQESLQSITRSHISQNILVKAFSCLGSALVDENRDNQVSFVLKFAYGVCLKFGIGSQIDSSKSMYWINEAKKSGGFLKEFDQLALFNAEEQILDAEVKIQESYNVSPVVPLQYSLQSPNSISLLARSPPIASLPPLPSYNRSSLQMKADIPDRNYPTYLAPVFDTWELNDILMEDITSDQSCS